MLEIKNLYKSYKTNTSKYDVLKNVSFTIKKGEFVAVMGPSGSGKTTLLNSISNFIPFDSGEILLNGESISNLKEEELANVRNEKLGFVFQDFMLLDGLTIFENICLPQIIATKNIASMEASANKLCEIFGISHIKNKYPAEISGGEKQRTAVARALINNPFLILADEPTGNLDSNSSRDVLELLTKVNKDKRTTIVMVTHDPIAASYCDRVLFIKDGEFFNEIYRDDRRQMFFQRILNVLSLLGGGQVGDLSTIRLP